MPTCEAGSSPPSSTRAPRRRRGSGGFTLLELVVTLAVVALLAALAAPAVASRLLERPAPRTARLLRGLIEEGREAASARGRLLAVVWAPAFGRFALVAADSGGGAFPARSLAVPDGMVVETRDLAAVEGGAWGGNGAVGLVLLPVGGSTGGELTLRSEGESVSVRIDPLTGYAEYAAGAGGPTPRAGP